MSAVGRMISKVLAPWRKGLRMVDDSFGWFRIDEPFLGAFQQDFHEHNIDSVMRNSAVYACISLISQDIGKLRPKLVQQQKSGIWKEISSGAFSPVLRKPNAYQNRIKFYEYWIASKLSRGTAYVLKERDDRGVVHAMHILDPWRVTPLVSDFDGSVFYRLNCDLLAGLPDEVVVPASEVIYDPMVTMFHPLVGVSPIFACATAAIQGLRIQSNSVKFFANMSRPSGVLTAPGSIGDETAARLKKEWQDNFGGKNIGKVAVLGDGLHYEAMAVNAVDAQLIEQLKWSGETVCSVFHVPTYMVGLAPPPPNNNIEALTQQYLGQCLQSLIESMELALEEGLDMVTPTASFGVEFDLDGLLRMDTATRFKTYKDGISAGWMAPNEARHCEDYEPVEGGDTPYLQVQNYSLAALAERDAEGPPSKLPPSAPPALPAAGEGDDPKPGDPGYEDADSKSLEYLLELMGTDAASEHIAGKVREKVATAEAA